MLIFFVFVKLLSLMTNTRERQSHYSGWETSGSGDPCAGKRPDERLRDLYREYAGRSIIRA